MLAVNIVCVGKIKESYFRDAIAEYEKRLKPLCKFEIIEIAEARVSENPSTSEIEAALQVEGEQILKKASGKIVPLCIEGEQVSSEKLATLMEKAMEYPGNVSFIIGSSHGLSQKVKGAGTGISMGKMTFPHTLARVMLTEQIYRAMQIIKGTKYHK